MFRRLTVAVALTVVGPSFALADGALFSFAPSFGAPEPITVGNFSFEEPPRSDVGSGTSTPPWVSTGSAGNFNPGLANYSGPIPDGEHVGYTSAGGQLSQTLSEVLQAGRYTLSVAVIDRLDGAPPQYDVRLLAGATQIGLVDETDFPPVNNNFVTATLQTTILDENDPLLGELLTIQLAGTGGGQANWDNVQLTFEPLIVPLTPEPTSLVLFGAAVASMAGAAWWRKRRAV